MHDRLSLPFICTADTCAISQKWPVYLKKLMNQPGLQEDEKYLWLWLASQCANHIEHSCSYSYFELSLALNKPCKRIHRALFRLRIMGFLIADIPIWYGEPPANMGRREKSLEACFPGVRN